MDTKRQTSSMVSGRAILKTADCNGYIKLDKPPDGWLSFFRPGPRPVQIDINLSNPYIITKLFHPKKISPTKLGRKVKNNSNFISLLGKIFENPRTHTGLGEYLDWNVGEKHQFYQNIKRFGSQMVDMF